MAKKEAESVKVSTLLPESLYTALKVRSATSGQKIRHLVQEAIEAHLAQAPQ